MEKQEIEQRARQIVADHLCVDAGKVTNEASFVDDLGADSLDEIELIMAFEEQFGVEIPNEAAMTVGTFADATRLMGVLLNPAP